MYYIAYMYAWCSADGVMCVYEAWSVLKKRLLLRQSKNSSFTQQETWGITMELHHQALISLYPLHKSKLVY